MICDIYNRKQLSWIGDWKDFQESSLKENDKQTKNNERRNTRRIA